MATNFALPELGENVDAGDVLRVLVKVGDLLAKDQPVLELETDKATIEVPVSVSGRVTDVKVKAGDKVRVGQVILSVEEGVPGAASGGPAAEPPAKIVPATTADEPASSQPTPAPEDSDIRSAPLGVQSQKVVDIGRGARQQPESPASDFPAPASPSVRRMARELGVDVNQVAGTGPDGRISIDDIKAHTKRLLTRPGFAGGGGIAAEPLPDFTRWGEVAREPMRGVRRKTAEHLSVAWATIPHVTQHDYADITPLEDARKRYAKQVEAQGGNLTVTAVAVKIVAAALKVFPQFNASIDLSANEIITKMFVNIGVAVDTDRGLLVPVIHNADTKNLTQISIELSQLSEKARNRKISLDEMQGGCFSVSNLGGIGGSFFTPIVNAPEVAILGISRGKIAPVYDAESGQFIPRQLLPLSLSYDHRVIDGADGIRFLRWIVDAFEQPFVLALHG